MKVDLWSGKIVGEETEEKPLPEEEKKIKPEDMKELVEKGKEAWKKMMEVLEAWRREAEKRKVEEAFKRAGIEILPKEKKGVLEELDIEKM